MTHRTLRVIAAASRILLVFGTVGCSSPALRHPSTRTPIVRDEFVIDGGVVRTRLPWHHQIDGGRLISRLPAWPTDRDLTGEEWLAYIRLAYVMSNMSIDDVGRCFDAYMLMHSSPSAEHNDKPMLLLRVMFDLPDEVVDKDGYPVFAYGGLVALSLTGGDIPYSLSSPVDWSSGNPALCGYRRTGPALSGIYYDPRAELLWMHGRFPYRELEHLIDQPIPSLSWLDAIQRLEAVGE